MTDRIKGIVITFEDDLPIDNHYFEALITVLLEIKGVANVEYSYVITDDYFNRERIKNELKTKLLEDLK